MGDRHTKPASAVRGSAPRKVTVTFAGMTHTLKTLYQKQLVSYSGHTNRVEWDMRFTSSPIPADEYYSFGTPDFLTLVFHQLGLGLTIFPMRRISNAMDWPDAWRPPYPKQVVRSEITVIEMRQQFPVPS